MNTCFEKLPIGIYPLKLPAWTYLENFPKNRMDCLLECDNLNPELIDFFTSKKIKIRENFILWYWRTDKQRDPHTDGNYFSDETTVKKRLCGINWNFSPGTRVEFYSTEGITPQFWHRGDYDFSTSWPGANKVIDCWDDAGPVIFNPQIPHDVKSDDRLKRRLSLTLRFYETYESLKEKLYV
jgi:hypothetical protein